MRTSVVVHWGTHYRLLLLSVGALALMACRLVTATPPPPEISVGALRDLLIDRSLLPWNWWADAPPRPLPYEEKPAMVVQDLWIHYSRNGDADTMASINHVVYYCGDPRAAARAYRKLPGWFYNASRVTPYAAPEWLPYESPVADRFRFECAEFQGIAYGDYPAIASMRCVAVGQYGSYITGFDLSVSSPEEMRELAPLLESLLETIDERMAPVSGG